MSASPIVYATSVIVSSHRIGGFRYACSVHNSADCSQCINSQLIHKKPHSRTLYNDAHRSKTDPSMFAYDVDTIEDVGNSLVILRCGICKSEARFKVQYPEGYTSPTGTLTLDRIVMPPRKDADKQQPKAGASEQAQTPDGKFALWCKKCHTYILRVGNGRVTVQTAREIRELHLTEFPNHEVEFL